MVDAIKTKKTLVLQTACWFLVGLVAVMAFDKQPYGVVYNTTASIPKGIYLTKTISPFALKKGDVACFPYKAPEWAVSREYFLEGRRLCKFVYGLPGDTVVKDGNKLWVGELTGEPLATLSAHDSKGRFLPSDALESGKVPQGKVLMLAPAYANSFDSRYLGYIPLEQVTTQAWPLWTF